ncbi:MAG TPA: nuclear transport factor 2 family protein [Nocardioidaceae bacterium]|nr:nuclear transport factor 2 family protein [Nocardioidaceae bacterium]
MSDTARADQFAQALQQMEQSGDPADLLAQFSDGAELKRPEVERSQPTTDADQFWSAYRAQFSEISTEFTTISEAGDLAVLEWTSRATLEAGRSIEYAGVSLLTFGEGDKVSRFSTYYDTAAFVTPAA